jgi:hypothetical protein
VKSSAHRSRLKRLELEQERQRTAAAERATSGQFPVSLMQLHGLKPMTAGDHERLRVWMLAWDEGLAEARADDARHRRWRAYLAKTKKRPCWDDFLELEAKREKATG